MKIKYNADLDGLVLTLDNGKTAQCQWEKMDNVLHADHGEEYLDRYDEYDSEDLTDQEQDMIDSWVAEHKWSTRDDFSEY